MLWKQFNLNGECPANYAVGDWSDDSGECCCDPYNQPGGNGQTTGETPIPMTTGETPIPMTTGESPMPTESTPTPTGLIPFLLTTPKPTGLMPYLLSSMGSTKEPDSSASTSTPTSPPTSTPAPAEPLPSVPDYEPSSKPEPLKFCKCRPGVTTTPAPTTNPGLTPYLLTTKPGLTPTLLSSISSTSKHPHLMTTRPSFGFTGMTSGSPSRYLRRRGQLLKLFL